MGVAFRRTLPVVFLTDGDMSSNITGDWVDNAGGLTELTIMYKWTGTLPVGELKVEADGSAFPHAVADPYDLTLTPLATIDTASGTGSIVLSAPVSRWRLKYVRTSGNGTLNAKWQGHNK